MMCCTVSGQGAGVAAAVSLRTDQPFAGLDVSAVQDELRRQRCASTDRAGTSSRVANPDAAAGRRPARPGADAAHGGTDGLSPCSGATRTLVGHPSHAGWPRPHRTEECVAPMVVARQRPGEEQPPSSGKRPPAPPTPIDPDRPTRADALRRIAAEVSGRQDLGSLFRDVIDESFALFGVDQAGLWTYDDSPTPLTLVAQRGLSEEIIAIVDTLPRDAQTAGMGALRERVVRVIDGDLSPTPPRLRTIYRRAGVRTICFVPIVFRDEPARPARALPHDRLRLDRRRDRPRPRLRRPHRDRHRQCPAGRLDADDGRAAAGDLRPRRPAQPAPGRRTASPRRSWPRPSR